MVLSGLNVDDSRRRREIYNKIVLEANYRALNTDGLTFTDTLLLIAHNKLIDEEKALS
jgi:voltage-dependent calcium channel